MSHATTTQHELTLEAPGITCGHCVSAVTAEVSQVRGEASVDVDLETKLVRGVGAGIDPAAVVDAIDEAGYDAVAA